MTDIDAFFARYEQGANSFDPDLVASQFTDPFMGGDPNGVMSARNDEAFRRSIPQRQAFMQGIGFRFARVLAVAATPLDAHYTMARVHWHLRFEKTPGAPQDFLFHIASFLFDPDSGTGPKVAFYISHEDEQQVMREAGLLPDAPTDGHPVAVA